MKPLVTFVRREFEALRDPEAAPVMAAYMKTAMPFYGIKKPARVPVYRAMVREFPAKNRRDYESAVLGLWRGAHREDKYAAIEYAQRFKAFIEPESLPLYERLIREGAWWDFVDDVAIRLVGAVLLAERESVRPTLDRWLVGDDLWLRRSVIISQIKHRDQTDHRALFADCRRCFAETEFFIRKAIGWALREYAKTAPDRVLAFAERYRQKMAPLSYREAVKNL